MIRRPWLTLILALAVVAPFAASLPDLRFDASIERLTDPESERWRVLSAAKADFGSDDVIVIAVIGSGSVVDPDRLRRLRELSRRLGAVSGVRHVWSLTETGHADGDADSIRVVDLVDELPPNGEELERWREKISTSPLFRDHLVSPDGRTAAIVLFPDVRPRDVELQGILVRGVREVLSAYEGPERLVVTGNPWVTEEIGGAMESEQRRFATWTVVGIAIVLLAVFRSFPAAALPLVASGMAVAVVMGWIALRGHSVSILSSVIPSVALAIGTTYAMHLLVRYRDLDGGAVERVRRAAAENRLPIALSCVTTMAGFGALALSPIDAVSELGAFTMVAVGVVGIAVLVLVPPMLAIARPRLDARPEAGSAVRLGLRGLARRVVGHRRAVLVGAALFTAVAAAGIPRLEVRTTWVDFLAEEDPVNVSRRELVRHLAGPNPILVVLDTGREGGGKEPDVLRAVAAAQAEVGAIDGVDATFALTNLLADMNRVAHAHEPEPDRYFRVPDTRALVAQYLLLYASSPFAADLDRLVSFDQARLALWLRTSIYDSKEFASAADRVREIVNEHLPEAGVAVTGTLDAVFRSTDDIARGQVLGLAAAAAVIGLLITAYARSFRMGVVAAIPNVLPLVGLFGAMGWLGIPIDVGTSLVACICLGVATDDTLHFVHAYRVGRNEGVAPPEAVERAFDRVGPAIVYTTVTLVIGFSVLLLSRFQPIASLGGLTAWTMIGCLGADLLILPALLLSLGDEGRETLDGISDAVH